MLEGELEFVNEVIEEIRRFKFLFGGEEVGLKWSRKL